MQPHELIEQLKAIVERNTVKKQQITSARWKAIDNAWSALYFEEDSKARVQESGLVMRASG